MRILIFTICIPLLFLTSGCLKDFGSHVAPVQGPGPTPSLPTGWCWQNPIPQGNALTAVKLLGAHKAIAVGYSGTVIRSVDDGATWAVVRVDVSAHLWDVDFADENTGLMVALDGTILKTTNGGGSWFRVAVSNYTPLWGVSMSSEKNATVVGNRIILRTTDGGTSWIRQDALSGTSSGFGSVKMIDSLTTYVLAGDGTILRTSDGGFTWVSQIIGTQYHLLCFDFADAHTGTAVGIDGTIVRTTNGGMTWVQQASGTDQDLYGVSFSDAFNGVAVGGVSSETGETSVVLGTRDGGLSWTTAYLGDEGLYGAFSSGVQAVAVGEHGAIMRSTGAVSNWESMRNGITESLEDVWFTDTRNGIAVGGRGTILRTTDGGLSWSKQVTNQGQSLMRIHFVNANIGTVVGWDGAVLRTDDGGNVWAAKQVPGAGILWAVFFIDENTGFVGGRGIYKTVDGGLTWASQLGSMTIRELHFVNSSTGFAVGDFSSAYRGVVCRTTDGGTNWVVDWDEYRLSGLSFVDSHNGFALGQTGILKTTDGGTTWSQVQGTYPSAALRISFADMQNGIAVGYDGAISRTFDGGGHWQDQRSGTSNYLRSVSMPSADVATVVGDYGTVLHTTTGGN